MIKSMFHPSLLLLLILGTLLLIMMLFLNDNLLCWLGSLDWLNILARLRALGKLTTAVA